MKKDEIDKLNRKIRQCTKCKLYKNTTQSVPGSGNTNAMIMLIGEAPGKEEDRKGAPFVGRSGRYLNETLERNGLRREDLYITAVVKHRPPDNRNPHKEEIAACIGYLGEEIGIIQPEVIVLMGKTAREHVAERKGIRYLRTSHPAAAMRFRKRYGPAFQRQFKKLGQTK